MDTKVDWLSFTVPVQGGYEDVETFAQYLLGALWGTVGETIFDKCFQYEWKERKAGRAPYSHSHDVGETSIVVFSNPKRNDALVELSGKACEFVRSLGLLKSLIERVQTRVTRVDLATDIETKTKPTEFSPKEKYASTFTYSELNSRTGQTVYLGSINSERYTRVYRYAPPHPRAKYLRVEFVFRRKVARAICEEILVQGEAAVSAWAGNKAHFDHKDWKPTDTSESITTTSKQEWDAGRTIVWFKRQVAPAFRRLVSEGAIRDPELFLREVFDL